MLTPPDHNVLRNFKKVKKNKKNKNKKIYNFLKPDFKHWIQLMKKLKKKTKDQKNLKILLNKMKMILNIEMDV